MIKKGIQTMTREEFDEQYAIDKERLLNELFVRSEKIDENGKLETAISVLQGLEKRYATMDRIPKQMRRDMALYLATLFVPLVTSLEFEEVVETKVKKDE